MPVDPNIALQIRSPEFMTPAQALSLKGLASEQAARELALQQQQYAWQQQQQVRDVLNQQGSIDQSTGMPTGVALSQISRVDPVTGMKLREQVNTAERTRQMFLTSKGQADKNLAELTDKRFKITQDLKSSALNVYDQALAAGLSHDQATQKAQQHFLDRIEETKKSGVLGDAGDPGNTTFNPDEFRAQAISYKDRLTQEEKAKHDRAIENKAGATASTELAKLNADLESGRITQQQHDARMKKLTDPAGGKTSAITQRYNQRSIVAGDEVLRGLDQIAQMPVGQSTGLFSGHNTGGITGGLKAALARNLTDQDATDYNTAISSMGLELTTLLRGGMNINEAELNAITEASKVHPGETVGNARYKIASVAAKALTAVEGLEPSNKQEANAKARIIKALKKYPSPEQVYAEVRGKKPPEPRETFEPPPAADSTDTSDEADTGDEVDFHRY